MIAAGTGHRPDRLGGYTIEGWRNTCRVARLALEEHQPSIVISGMAQGWDQALAKEALEMHIPVYAYIPFDGQDSRWTDRSRLYYQRILLQCAKVVRNIGSYILRDKAMVDDCDYVLALWSGEPSGTGRTVDYARKRGVTVYNYWSKL